MGKFESILDYELSEKSIGFIMTCFLYAYTLFFGVRMASLVRFPRVVNRIFRVSGIKALVQAGHTYLYRSSLACPKITLFSERRNRLGVWSIEVFRWQINSSWHYIEVIFDFSSSFFKTSF